jgi:hypothetical protein
MELQYHPRHSRAELINEFEAVSGTYYRWQEYSFVNRTIQLWNQLSEDALGTLSCKPSSFRKRVRKVINKAK